MTGVVMFDLDGTLFDTAPDICRAVELATLPEGLAQAPLEFMKVRAGHGLKALIKAQAGFHGHVIKEAELDRLSGLAFQHYSNGMLERTLPFPGALEALLRLKARNCPMAILSNKTEILARQLLDHFDLAGHFATITGGNSYPFKKPDPAVVTETLARAGYPDARTILIGDSDTDVQTARRAGIPIVAVSFGYMAEPISTLSPDAIIDHFDELDAVLNRFGF